MTEAGNANVTDQGQHADQGTPEQQLSAVSRLPHDHGQGDRYHEREREGDGQAGGHQP